MSDLREKPVTETTALFRDLDKPSLHGLSYALRHPDVWPEGFIWNYGNCDNCAMGLAHALWRSSIPEMHRDSGCSIMARTFAMPYGKADSIFLGDLDWIPTKKITEGHLWWREHRTLSDFRRVTPEMVADQIDIYLASAE